MAEHATQAFIGWGSILYRGNGDGPPETFTEIEEVTAFTPPQTVADEIDVSHFQSPGARREFIAGMIDSGEATATINYNPSAWTQHAQLSADAEARTVLNWRFTLPGEIETIDFRGFIKQFNRQVAPSDSTKVEITWRVSSVDTTIES